MAWGFVTSNFATGQEKTSDTTLAFSSGTYTAGRVYIAVIGTDNFETVTGVSTQHSSISDAGSGNTWNKGYEYTDGGTAAAHVTTSIWWMLCVTGGARVVTANFANAITAKAGSISEFTITASGVVTLEGSNGARSATDCPSIAISGLSSREYLFIRGDGGEGTGFSSYVNTSGYAVLTEVATSGGSATTNIFTRGEYDILTGTGSTSDPTTTADTDKASVLIALKEVAGGTTTNKNVDMVAVGVAALTKNPIWAKALAMAAVGVAGLSKNNTFVKALASTAVGVTTLVKAVTKAVFAPVAVGVAAMVKKINPLAKAMTAVGVAGFTQGLLFSRTLASTAVGVVTFAKSVTFVKTFAPVAVGVATLSKLVGKPLAMIAVGVATMNKKIQPLAKAIVAVGVAGFTQSKVFLQAFAMTAVGIANVSIGRAFFRTFAMVAVGVAAMTKMIPKLFAMVSVGSVATPDRTFIPGGGGGGADPGTAASTRWSSMFRRNKNRKQQN